MLIYISCQSLGSINPYFRTLKVCIWRLFLKLALIIFPHLSILFQEWVTKRSYKEYQKKANITSPKEFHINFMTISKNLIKGKGGQLRDQLANHFCVWQDSMNMFGKKILLGQDPHQLSGISQYILREIKLF